MKKIGFVDYYISEWHANNYMKWLADAIENSGYDFEIAYAWAELDISLFDGVTTGEWCEKYGVERCNTLEELCEKSDYILILAPSNPETHLKYAETVLKYGKNTFIDKTFAPDLKTARKIFELAAQYNTKFFSSSALRYANELVEYSANAKAISITFGGSNLPEYIVHPVEIATKSLGASAKSVRLESAADQTLIRIAYTDGRAANLLYSPTLTYSAIISGPDGKSVNAPKLSGFFPNLMRDIVRFFSEGSPSFDTSETLAVMRVRDAIFDALKNPGKDIVIK